MKPPGFGADPEATHALRRAPRRRARAVLPSAGMALLAILAGAAWLARRPAAPAAAPAYPLADEAAILAAPADRLAVWRFGPDPAILVLAFPTLHAQALTLNRVAAFIEKADTPHDRVLDDVALEAAVRHGRASFDLYYAGHDYRAPDLFRFLDTAARQHVALRPEEQAVGDLLRESGAASVITLPPPGPNLFDAAGRAAILRHELAHGAYFAEPAYTQYVAAFWNDLTEAERAAFRAWLGARGYDTGNEDLMRNEMQAYLVFTPDVRLFRARSLAIGEPAALALRARFVAAMPGGWLRARAAD